MTKKTKPHALSIMEISRRDALLGAAAAGAGALVLGSLTRPAAAAPKKGGTAIYGCAHGSTTDLLDPGTYENDFMIGYSHTINNFLTEVTESGELIPELSDGWEASADASTWTFPLKKGVTFHSGKELTAEDVVASINHHRGEDSTSAAKPIVSPIKDIKADGKHTVVVTLEGGNADFPYLMADYHLPIHASKDGKIDWNANDGSGAYIVKEFEPGVRAHFERNPNYWKEGRAHFDEVTFLSIIDPAARTNALVTGEVNIVGRADLKTVHLLKRRPNLRVESVTGNQHYTFPMLTNVAPFDDPNVRLALKWAVDREQMVEKILQGYGSVGNDHPIGPANRYLAKDLEQRKLDPDKAKFYLDKAGLSELSVPLHVADAAFAGAVDAGQLYSEDAAKAGITIEVVREPNDGYWSNVWIKKPWCACYWGGRPTEDWMFSTAYEAGVPWNDTHWNNKRFNELLIQARSELDENLRREMYHEMQALCADDGGTVVPMFAAYVYAMEDKVKHGPKVSNYWDLDGQRFAERWWLDA